MEVKGWRCVLACRLFINDMSSFFADSDQFLKMKIIFLRVFVGYSQWNSYRHGTFFSLTCIINILSTTLLCLGNQQINKSRLDLWHLLISMV